MHRRTLGILLLGAVVIGAPLTRAKCGPTEKPPAVSDKAASERFWRKQFQPILPKDWIVSWVKPADAPISWTRTADGGGVQVYCQNPKKTIKDRMVGPYHPFVSVWIMPEKWEGHSDLNPTQKIEKNAYRRGDGRENRSAMQIYPAAYIGSSSPRVFGESRHFLRSTLGEGDWTSASKDIARQFSL